MLKLQLRIVFSTLVASALLTSGCAASPTADVPAAGGAPQGGSPAGCVVDPAAVAARSAIVSTDVLPEALVVKLRAATEAARTRISSPGAIVAAQTPEGRWIEAFGTADPATGRAMTVNDVHRIGSLTKTFTGTVILQRAEEGKLSLDDTIDQYVPGVPNGEHITLHMLITMVSGLASYTLDDSFQEQWFADPQREWTAAQ